MWKKFLDFGSEFVAGSGDGSLDSFWPVFRVMQIYGFDLDMSLNRSRFRRYAFMVWAVIAFAFTEMALVSDYYYPLYLYKMDGNSTNLNSSRGWFNTIVSVKWMAWDAIFPIVMCTTIALKWPKLWEKMTKMQSLMNYKSTLPRQMHLFVLISTATFFIGEFIYKEGRGFYSELITHLENGNWFKFFADAGIVFADFFEIFSINLFICLTQLACQNLQIIIEQVKGPSRRPCITEWKRSYCSISSFIQEIDEFFACFLFILFAKLFCGIPTFLFSLAFNLVTKDYYLTSFKIGYIVKVMIIILAVQFQASRMTNKASLLSKELSFRRYFSTILHSDIDDLNELIQNIRDSPPILCPLGMFVIDPSLVPTVTPFHFHLNIAAYLMYNWLILQFIQITITYMLVMAEFAMSNW